MPNRITEAWVVERLDTIWPAYNASFARLLSELRHHFDGDLDAMLILLTISLGVDHGNWRGALLEGEPGSLTQRATNTQSIAQSTGIPRESVRRKIALLAQKGWIARSANGNWHVRHKAATDLKPATTETISFLRAVLAAGLNAELAGRHADVARQGHEDCMLNKK